MSFKAVVVRTGRSSYGEMRRTETWARLFRASGGECRQVTFLSHDTAGLNLAAIGPVALGNRVPETLVWHDDRVAKKIRAIAPDVVVLQTARAFQPELLDGPWVTVLDLVDRLSLSYLQRSALSRGPRSLAFAALASAHAGFEASAIHRVERVVAAGRSDAAALGARWIPNLLDASSRPTFHTEPPYDAVFFGSLGYRPNIDALEWLASGHPKRHGLRILVAGSAPTDYVRQLCISNDFALEENYPDNKWLGEQAREAIAPLRSAAGIQNKVIEAAMIGLPQVLTTSALAGLAANFPARVSDTADGFVDAIADLRVSEDDCRLLADEAWVHACDTYTVDGWVPSLWDLVEATPGQTRPRFGSVSSLMGRSS